MSDLDNSEFVSKTKELKAKFGIDCPGCKERFPRAIPSRLLPGWKCRTCGYVDDRPRISESSCPHCKGTGLAPVD